jgi:hypothetical protein
MTSRRIWAAIAALATLAPTAPAYEVWLGTHKWEGVAADNLNQWDMAIDKIDGINYVLLDARAKRPAGEGANTTDWRTMIAPIDQSIPGMAEIARSQYAPASNRSLASRMENEFATARNNGGYEIDVIMLYDEARDGTVWKYNLQDVQDVRAWLDNNGHVDVSIVFRLTNNDQERLGLARQSVVDGVLIEGSATRWVENRNNLHTLLQNLWTDPRTSGKNIYFQIPRHESPGSLSQRNGIPASPINQYIETRRALWAIKNLMGDAFMRSDQAIFIVVNYGDTYGTFPETESNDTRYVNTRSGLALSLIEQRPIFEGRTGVVNDALCASYDRFEVILAPDSGLVAHWPLDEDSGTVATDATGFGADGTRMPGASWASDALRGTHMVFDGTSGRIETPFTYALEAGDNFTWAWWAKKTTPSGTDNGAIMIGNRYPQGPPGETFEFIKFTPTGAQFANTDNSSQIGKYDYAVPSGDWNHYAMVKNGASYQLYINGIPVNSTEPTFTYDETSPIPFFIGGDGGGGESEHFTGGIDDVVLYRSALTQQEVNNVMNGIYLPIVTMVALGTPVDSTAAATWSDNLPAHGGANYVIPSTGNLRGETGTTVFPGDSLTVQAGGRFQVRAIESNVTTVNDLILQGGPSFNTGQFAELAAGTGTSVTNVIDGRITQSGTTRLLTFGGSTARKLKVLSRIDGDGTLQVTGLGAIIGNLANGFSGTWEIASGSSLVFENAGAVGAADLNVQSGGMLEIKGSWTRNAVLTVANISGTEVKVGPNEWNVSSLLLGGVPVKDGIYLPSDLSGLGSALFSGTGRITVGTPVFTQEVVAGWDFWNSNTAPVANVTGSGITATATTSTASGNWSTTEDSSSGRGSSGDTTWGSFDGGDRPASSVTSGAGANMTALNGVTTAEMTFTITNNGEADWNLGAFHMDVIAFRANAPRAYQLKVLSGDITHGIVFTSADDEINQLGGSLTGTNDEHDDIDVSLLALADSTLEPGESATFQIVFSSGTGSAAGHHLFLDNVAVSGVLSPVSELQSWRYEHFQTIENTGTAADDFDANSDGESNLLEYATGQNPHANTLAKTALTPKGADLEFRYARSNAATADGFQFTVEWSATLLPGSWSTAGVTDVADTENPGTAEVQNRIATIPAGDSGHRFVRLKVHD